MKPLRSIWNPFDFANPVNDIELLAGRESQLKEAEYYLDQFTYSGTAINLALLGERAAGKTSLLNAIQDMALKREQVVARIDLTEGDVQSPLHFWFKTFDQALSSTVEAGGFDGESSPFYDGYLQIVGGHGGAVADEFRVFRSAELFAHLAHEHDTPQVVHEGLIRKDLGLLIKEMRSGLVLVFDECDVLRYNQALLQQFRNVFMKMRNCLVVIAATPDLFPAISAAYSPIIRQFKSIHVGAFDSFQDVHRCVTVRLSRAADDLGIKSGSDDAWHQLERVEQVARWSDPVDRFTFIHEVHEASGGLPHQVQLLCHLAFRRLQRGEATRLALSIEVLEEATREIGLTDTADARPLHRAITDLNEDLRNGLHFLARCSGKATLEQMALVARIGDPERDWSDEAASRRLERLVDVGLLAIGDGGAIEFVGDPLDRVYGRLHARLRNERLSIASLSLESHFSDTLEERVRGQFGANAPTLTKAVAPAALAAVRRILSDVEAGGWEAAEMIADAFAALRPLSYDGPGSGDVDRPVRVATVSASSRWCECSFVLVHRLDVERESSDSATPLAEVRTAISDLEAAVSTQTNEPCSVELFEVPHLPTKVWRSYVVQFGTPRQQEDLAEELAYEGVARYVAGDTAGAADLFKESLEIAKTTECLNDLGYLQFESGDLDAARLTYAEAAELDPLHSLILYNFALTLACSGDLEGADHQAERASVLDEKPVDVMHIPVLLDGKIEAVEQTDDPPGPIEAAHRLRELIAQLREAEEPT